MTDSEIRRLIHARWPPSRMARASLAAALAIVLVGSAGWWFHAWRPPAGAVRASTPPAPPLAPAEVGTARERRASVTAGTSIHALLSRMGIGGPEIDRIVKGFSPVADLTKCRPGEELSVGEDGAGQPVSVIYRKNPLEVYQAVATPSGWRASRQAVLSSTRVERVAGSIDSSLFQAVDDAGETDALAIALADILAWEIDFAHESQRGDRFVLLVGKEHADGRLVRYGDILAAEYAMAGRRSGSSPCPTGRAGWTTTTSGASRLARASCGRRCATTESAAASLPGASTRSPAGTSRTTPLTTPHRRGHRSGRWPTGR